MSDLRVNHRDPRVTALARNWWALILRGVIAVLFGLLAFLEPAGALASIVLVAGIYLLVDGAFGVVAALRAATHHGKWVLLLIEGLLGIGLGLIAIVHPNVAISVAVLLAAAWALLTGALMVGAAFRLSHGRWLLALGGVVSLLWGAMLALFPIPGAVVLTIWLGAYAFIFGISMIALGLRLRAWHSRSGQ